MLLYVNKTNKFAQYIVLTTSTRPVSCDTNITPIITAIVIRVRVSGSDDLEHGTIRRALVLVTTLPLQV